MAGLVGVALLAVIAWRAGRIWVAMVLAVLAVTLLAAGTRSWQLHTSPVAGLAAAGAVATVEFEVLAEPVPGARVVVAPARLLRVESRGSRSGPRCRWWCWQAAAWADSWRPSNRDPDTRAGQARHARPGGSGGRRVVTAGRGPPHGGPGPLRALANSMRAGLRDAVSHSPPDQAALVPSLVVGDTSRVDDDMKADFRATGLTHLMAVSGANLTLMLGVLLAFVRAVGVRGWWVRVAAVGGVGLFVLVCGQEPSVLRATAMGWWRWRRPGSARGAGARDRCASR
ncbi:hypothetical protein G7085_01570 [Tessaracoccus sp. HDW20]|uniref:ComEC/Rec2 family competence protein n=1 Tax=Tessaracoccus coleopterorum TaxID=2714950 RepID=UPI0018D4D3E0|nr:ComEC/Rec2 family competence protein [Tessaracoccus coleopterorum]NHB83821.1 hypothetical protein [Tessaracoccus coleopterorum]